MVGKKDAKQRIRQAALEMFLKHGVRGAPVPDIVLAAQAGTGSLYRHYSNKEEIANEILSQVRTSIADAVEIIHTSGKPVRLQIHETFKAQVQIARKTPLYARFEFLHQHAEYEGDSNKALQARIQSAVSEMFKTAAIKGYLRLGALHLPQAIYTGALVSMVAGHAVGKFTLDDEEIEWMESGCWRAISR